ncbi:CehA/McbA family metallohydrolase, partial [Gemmatimonadota bacterium]
GAADQFNNLYVQPALGGEPYKLTFFEHDAFHPRWSPDGQWIAYVSNEGGLPQLELLETFGGKRRQLGITGREYREPMGTLRLTVLDESGPAPTPARVTLYASDGKVWTPTDAYARIGQRGGYPGFHTTGTSTLDLPPGEVDITVMKGFEREPQRHRIEIRSNQETEFTVRLQTLDGLDLDGWYNGSTHVHMNYGGNLHNTPENLMMMSDAEDQDVILPLVANKDNRILDHQFFRPEGGLDPVSIPERILYFGEEYRPPFYGHVFMIGLTDHMISPFVTGYEGTAIESLYPSNTDMLLKAKEQGAVTGYVHPFNGSRDPLDSGLGGGKGFMVDAALAAADVLEWSTSERAGFIPLYALWNNDIRVAASGGEDSISNLHWTPMVGAMRSYVRTPNGRLTLDGWLRGLKDGNSFVTNGPLLTLKANGSIPGSQLSLSAGGEPVEIEAEMRSVVPLTRVWLVANGEELMEVPLSEDRLAASLTTQLTVRESGWLHLRAEGERGERFPLDAAFPQAFTNPVWFSVGGDPIRDRASAEYGLRWIDVFQELALASPGWRSQQEIDHLLGQLEEAREVYRRLAQEAGGS